MLKSTLRGFTIIELAISVAVLSVVASIFAPVIGQGIDAILIIRSKEQLAQEAHLAMSWVTEDLKNNCVAITALGTGGFACTAPNGHNFQYAATYGYTQLDKITDGTTQQLVAKPIRFFQVRGYPAVGGATGNQIPNYYLGGWPGYPTAPTNLSGVKIIQIYLSIGDEQNHYELMTAIHPRLIP